MNNLNIHRVNSVDDLEQVIPKPVPNFNGFYFFPENENIGVSRNGLILKIKSGKILKTRKHQQNGFNINIRRDGVNKIYKVHRILAITFIGRPSRHLDKNFDELEVNHIDCNRWNNSLDNLEWVTGSENNYHSHKSNNHSKDTPVQSMNLLTGEIRYYHSAKACADYFSISRATLFKHLNSNNSGCLSKDNHVFRYYSNTDWTLENARKLCKGVFTNSGLPVDYYIENMITKEQYLVDGIEGIRSIVYVAPVTLWRHIKRFGSYQKDNFVIKRYR